MKEGQDIKERAKRFPLGPGVYIMKSAAGKVLYVGKASSLKKRVGSYFTPLKTRAKSTASAQGGLSLTGQASRNLPKTEALLSNVADIHYIECDSPQQALILEAALIKENKPKYNIALRDSKSYPYVEVTDEEFPRVFMSRPRAKTKANLFGPYTDTKTLKSALALIRRILPFRSCRVMPKKPCLFFHLKLCPGPCADRISRKDYKVIIGSVCKILKGRRKELIKSLRLKMKKLAGRRNFEEAAKARDRLLAIEGLYKNRPQEHEIISLKEILNLNRLPLVIEAVDISSLGPNEAVGSLVAFRDGSPDKNSYRRFLIREVKGVDDYAMAAEVVRRRYSRLIREKRKFPDLLIIDGGKGHASRAQKELKALGVTARVVGIAKRNEEVWFPESKEPLIIPKDSPCLHLIQRVRDEAHRFAHSYLLYRRRLVNIKKRRK